MQARAARGEGPTFSEFLWQFVDGKPQINAPRTLSELTSNTPASDAMSKALKSQGFKFVGSTICYAFMQAVGMVNDHLIDCHVYEEVHKLAEK